MGPVAASGVSRVGAPVPLRPAVPIELALAAMPTEPDAAARPATPGPSLSAFLVIAGAQMSPAMRRAAAKPVAAGLDLLAELHAEVETGAPSPAGLQALAGWARKLTPPDDPELAALLREVETRALVELAKWGR